jgi:hypothetical protein
MLPDQTGRPTTEIAGFSAFGCLPLGNLPLLESLDAPLEGVRQVADGARARCLLDDELLAPRLLLDQREDSLAVLVPQDRRIEGSVEGRDQLLRELALARRDPPSGFWNLAIGTTSSGSEVISLR